jgi:hypothetical protein
VNSAGSIAVLGSNSRRLSVEYVDIDQLKRNARNPRDHDEKQIAKLEKSIVKFGWMTNGASWRATRVLPLPSGPV